MPSFVGICGGVGVGDHNLWLRKSWPPWRPGGL